MREPLLKHLRTGILRGDSLVRKVQPNLNVFLVIPCSFRVWDVSGWNHKAGINLEQARHFALIFRQHHACIMFYVEALPLSNPHGCGA